MSLNHGASDRRDRKGARSRLRLTIGMTGAIFFAELIGGYYSGSLALLSDAGHMLSDIGALLVSYFALLIATRPANARKTYGYYRTEILAALANALVLLVLTGFIIYEAFQRFVTPEPVLAGPMLAVAVVGLVANAISIAILRGESTNLNVRSALLHVLGDLISSVGVVVSGVLMLTTGAYVLDPVVSILIAILILFSAQSILREAVEVLLEAAPPGIDVSEVATAMKEVGGVASVHDLHVWSITSGMHALSCHLIVDPCRLVETPRILTETQSLLLERFGIDHTTLQIEPVEHECEADEAHAAH